MLSELEEIIQYKQFADQPERQISMRKTWMKRYVALVSQSFNVLMVVKKLTGLSAGG